ncbi:YpoC family protein [Alteribacter aurantiacus]|uniref:YpoC family protein n=1 Tax=Alteribacter aurantiacus TaxID=254410 RepID=UPI0003F76152|nr:hypothetical protein [Alteribacter aurantiacus]
MKKLVIPDCMQRLPFYSKNSYEWSWEEGSTHIPFFEDLTHSIKPWAKPKEAVSVIYKEWINNGEPELRDSFKKRDKSKAEPMMIHYIQRYIQMMMWGKGEPVSTLKEVEEHIAELPYSPFNIKERLSFVMNTPGHHHAFITLNQLFVESNKKLAVYFLQK